MLQTILLSVLISLALFFDLMIYISRLFTKGLVDEINNESKLNTVLLIDSLIKSDDPTLIEVGRRLFNDINK